MKKRYFLFFILFVATSLLSQQTNHFDKKEVLTYLEYLASDKLEGRNTPSKGLDMAADFIASEFAKYGLKPMGDSGTYFQNFTVHVKRYPEHTLIYDGKIFNKSSELLPPAFENLETAYKKVAGKLVFAGYGITEPALNYDDFEGIDVKNNIVIILRGFPFQNISDGYFNKKEYAKWKSVKNRIENARSHGAIGVLIAGDIEMQGLNLMKYSFLLRPFHSASTNPIKDRTNLETMVIGLLSENGFDKLFQPTGKTYSSIKAFIEKEKKPQSFNLSDKEASLEFEKTISQENTKNVAGLIEGTDPILKNEVIVVGAHYDHVGVIDGEVHNGADDDASGTVGVMEMAKTLVKNKTKRSILFIAFTGEEQGLIGSSYYTAHPLFPLDKTISMLQFDMISRDEETDNPESTAIYGIMGAEVPKYSKEQSKNAVNLLGLSYSGDLKKIVTDANSKIKLEFRMAMDSTSLFSSSDHYPFYRKKIPVCFFNTGDTPYLHRSTDDVETLNIDKMTKILELAYNSIIELGNTMKKIVLDKNK